jgi:hypothetical protein
MRFEATQAEPDKAAALEVRQELAPDFGSAGASSLMILAFHPTHANGLPMSWMGLAERAVHQPARRTCCVQRFE